VQPNATAPGLTDVRGPVASRRPLFPFTPVFFASGAGTWTRDYALFHQPLTGGPKLSEPSSTKLPSMAACVVVARVVGRTLATSRPYREPRSELAYLPSFPCTRDHQHCRESVRSDTEREKERVPPPPPRIHGLVIV
jgi:hypothetical protein